MTIKRIEREKGCFAKAFEDEELFVLRAKDPIAPRAVRAWADYAELSEAHEPEKIQGARECADRMEEWRRFYVGEEPS